MHPPRKRYQPGCQRRDSPPTVDRPRPVSPLFNNRSARSPPVSGHTRGCGRSTLLRQRARHRQRRSIRAEWACNGQVATPILTVTLSFTFWVLIVCAAIACRKLSAIRRSPFTPTPGSNTASSSPPYRARWAASLERIRDRWSRRCLRWPAGPRRRPGGRIDRSPT